MTYHLVVDDLAKWIGANTRRRVDFEQAIRTARSHGLKELEEITDLFSYLSYASAILTWTPIENVDGSAIYDRIGRFYFILNQPTVVGYQNRIHPNASTHHKTWLSTWIVSFGKAFGAYMDTPTSINESTLATFIASPRFRLQDYEQPAQGWVTFNKFFARRVRPEKRLVAAPGDSKVWTSPSDCTFVEAMHIGMDVQLTMKTISWSVEELLDNSRYAGRFACGMLVHATLNVFDYHRVHAPVAGKVVETRRATGSQYTQIEVVEVGENVANEQMQTNGSGEGPEAFKTLQKRIIGLPE